MAVRLQEYMIGLNDQVGAALADCGQGPVCHSLFLPGAAIAWDYCGSECDDGACGMSYVRLFQSFQYAQWPVPDLTLACNKPMGYLIEAGVLRCMPMPDERGEPPAKDDVAAVALGLLDDSDAIRMALSESAAPQVSLGTFNPMGPQGGCVGGSWTAYVSMVR